MYQSVDRFDNSANLRLRHTQQNLSFFGGISVHFTSLLSVIATEEGRANVSNMHGKVLQGTLGQQEVQPLHVVIIHVVQMLGGCAPPTPARGFGQAGLGLRSAQTDAPAAYLASVVGCASSCAKLDSSFAASRAAESHDVVQALAALNAQGARALTADSALSLNQKALTSALDTAGWEAQLATASVTGKALLRSEAARAFLAATARGRRRMEPALFVAELRQRLGMPDATADAWCRRCDSIMDKCSHHAGICAAGGERTLRHNALRDTVCNWALRAGLQPEKEKPGLLLPQRPEDSSSCRRRPADIFVPSY